MTTQSMEDPMTSYDPENPRVRYRHLFSFSGEGLIIPRDVMSGPVNLRWFRQATGLGQDDVIMGSMSAMPIPIQHEDDREDDGTLRWKNTRADTLWCPLFWLPERLATARVIDLGHGQPLVIEDHDMRAVRIAFEMQAAGLFDSEDGWLDVFYYYGIDVDNPADLERIAAWQGGAEDEVLDALSLDEFLEPLAEDDGSDWAAALTDLTYSGLRKTGWAILSDSLIDSLLQLQDSLETCEPDQFHRTLNIACAMAVMTLDDTGVTEEGELAAIEKACNEEAEDKGVLTQEIMAPLLMRLYEIRDLFWDELEVLRDSLNESGNPVPGLPPLPEDDED